MPNNDQRITLQAYFSEMNKTQPLKWEQTPHLVINAHGKVDRLDEKLALVEISIMNYEL